jgi:hypothetical protein
MKLSEKQIAVVKARLGADPLEQENSAMPALRQAFGDHTFYVGPDGLLIFEPLAESANSAGSAQLVLVASWTDENKNALTPVPARPTEQTVDFAADDDEKGKGKA